jgi:hypothetical protein
MPARQHGRYVAKLRGTMRFLSSIRIVRVTLALAVAFWMAGAGCLLGCENMVSAATAHEAASASSASNPAPAANVVVAADACAAMHAHGCCAKRGTQSVAKASSSATATAKPSSFGSHEAVANSSAKAKHTPADGTVVDVVLAAPFSTMMDCPLAVNATAALSKARPDEPGGELLPARADDSFSYFKEQLTALTPPSLLPNRGHTYLRCCVFLI